MNKNEIKTFLCEKYGINPTEDEYKDLEYLNNLLKEEKIAACVFAQTLDELAEKINLSRYYSFAYWEATREIQSMESLVDVIFRYAELSK